MPLVIAGLGVGLFAFVAAFVALGLSQTHTATHGGGGVAGYLDWLTHGGPLTGALDLGAKAARAVVSRVAGAQIKHLTSFFGGLAFLIGETYKTNANTATRAADAVQATDHRSKVAVKQLARREARANARLHAEAHHAEVHARSVGHALDAYKAREGHRISHLTHAIDVTLPRDIAGLRRRTRAVEDAQAKDRGAVADLEHGAAKTWDWIRSHPLSVVTTAFAGAVAIALSRLGYGFLRCRAWRNLGRSLTCRDANILRDLFALATVALASEVSVVEFVRFMQEIEDEALSEIHSFIRD